MYIALCSFLNYFVISFLLVPTLPMHFILEHTYHNLRSSLKWQRKFLNHRPTQYRRPLRGRVVRLLVLQLLRAGVRASFTTCGVYVGRIGAGTDFSRCSHVASPTLKFIPPLSPLSSHPYSLVIISSEGLPKGRSFTANSGTKAAVLPVGRSSIANQGCRFTRNE